ncbi:MAG: ABC transporter permease [Clostridia bacterium]|nr:ABC transporter permease [Clostridia bacterium]
MRQQAEPITVEMLTRVGRNAENMEAIVRPSLTYYQDAWRRLRGNKVAMAGLVLVCLYVVLSLIGPVMAKWDYRTNSMDMDLPPSRAHWFGTDTLGRDMWARVWVGARVSLSIGFISAIINSVVGVVIGGVSGYFGGAIDMIIMRLIDVLYGIPYMIIAILAMLVLGPGITSLIVAMVLVGWIGTARMVRGQILQLKEQEFVLAAEVLGAGHMRIIFRHLMPSVSGLLITNLTMAVPRAIFSEAFLSFIGLGVQPPYPSWGQLARYGAECFRIYPWELFIPAFFISTTMLSLNLLGDSLRDALDPTLRGTIE